VNTFPRATKTPRYLASAVAGLAGLQGTGRLLAATWAGPSTLGARAPLAQDQHAFAYDHVLGTSLDVCLAGCPAREARECETRLLAEIGRLERILSLYDPASEISRVKAGGPVESRELAEVLDAYRLWSERTDGALSPHLSGVIAAWQQAARTGREPDATALAAAFATPRAYNVDALGKGYVIDRVTQVARQWAPSGLLDIGGDLRAWGDRTWMIGVADPRNPADNAAPFLQFPLREAAVATSGGYARYFEVEGRRYSHLIDPRTLRPIAIAASATVVAPDCLTANALSTAAAVLGPGAGSALARTYGLDHLMLQGAAAASSFPGVPPASPPLSPAAASPAELAGANWPADFQLTVTLSLKAPEEYRARRPYVAIWVEDGAQKIVRTISVWGGGKYQPDLTKWWRGVGGNRSGLSSVTRATRAPGTYTVTWDGRDNQGTPLPQGSYKVFVEINREHGHHVWESAPITCGGEATTAEIAATAESDASAIAYGPKS
jgi:FAD:protein FMN transferase